MSESPSEPTTTHAAEPIMAPTNTTGLDPVEAAETDVDSEALDEVESEDL
jgi:hypothetical protein